MSLKITNTEGVDLIDQPPELVSVVAAPITGGLASLQCNVIEDSALLYDFVAGTLNWNDGSLPLVFNGTGTLAINEEKYLQPGSYTVTVEARNYRVPVSDSVVANFRYAVEAYDTQPVAVPVIYGPILPKDTGYPNQSQWNWSRGEDVEVLASSVKMLLTTRKGSRIAQIDYGTNISAVVFEFQGPGIETLIQHEIVEAITKWEPRVTLLSLDVRKTGQREVTVDATFVSKLNQRDFSVPMVFST